MDGERRPGVFQGKLQGWRRLAASLVLLPGLTAVGAEVLHLIGPARAQNSATPDKMELAVRTLKQARAAFERGDYRTAKELADAVKAMNIRNAHWDDSPEQLYADLARKAKVVKEVAPPPVRTTAEDPRVLVRRAREALDAGRPDTALDLARQADANGRMVEWGLFEESPASILKDAQKARGRRDQQEADRLVAQARDLYNKRSGTDEQRAANLEKARSFCLQALQMHGPYSMWHFGDRPETLIKDIDNARARVGIVTRPADNIANSKIGGFNPNGSQISSGIPSSVPPRDNNPVIYPRQTPSGNQVVRDPRPDQRPQPQVAVKPPMPFEFDPNFDPSFRPTNDPLGGGTVVSRPLHGTGSKQIPNIPFPKLPDQVVTLPPKLDPIMTAPKIEEIPTLKLPKDPDNVVTLPKNDEVPMPILPKDSDNVVTLPKNDTPGLILPPPDVNMKKDETPQIGMMPAPMIEGQKGEAVKLMQMASSLQKDGKFVEARKALVDAQKLNAAFGPEDETPEVAMQALMATVQNKLNQLCREAHESMVKKTANDVAAAEQKLNEAESLASGLGLDRWAITEHRSTLQIIQKQASGIASKPPAMMEPIMTPNDIPLVDPMNGTAKGTDKGLELLQQARIELRNNRLENARHITAQVLNGEFTCKNEAQELLRTIDGEVAAQRRLTARRSYERGVEELQSKNYVQALGIFKLVDPTLLPVQQRRAMSEHIASAQRMVGKGEAVVQAGNMTEIDPSSPEKTGADSLLKQQEAMLELQFQKLRSEGLQLESNATARFGKGETDAAMQDLYAFISKVKGTGLEPSKVALLIRPIESRMEKLKVLKHQQDFLTKEARDIKNFRNQMTQEALTSAHKHEQTARLMKDFYKLMDENKFQEANKVALMARELDPQDPAVGAALKISHMAGRRKIWDDSRAQNEETTFYGIQEAMELGAAATGKDPVKFDVQRFNEIKNRRDISGGLGANRLKSEADKKIESKLNSQLVSLNFNNTPLDEAIRYLQTYTGLNFDIDTRALEKENIDQKKPITSVLNNITLKSALEVVLLKADLVYLVEKEVVRVTTHKGAKGKQKQVTIPVADLVVPVQNFTPSAVSNLDNQLQHTMNMHRPNLPNSANTPFTPQMGLPNSNATATGTPSGGGQLRNQSNGGATISKSNATGTIEESLIRLITGSVHPDTWEAMGGAGRIEYYPLGMALVINQTPDVIEEVNRLLEALRQLQDLEIAIEVRMITLAESFYERMGLDFAMNIKTNTKDVEPFLTTGIFRPAPFINDNNLKGAVLGLQAPGIPTPDLDIPIRATSFGPAVPPFGGFPNAPGMDGGLSLGLAFLSDIQVQMFLEAAQGDRRTNVMQAPKLTMFNGQSATISIQDQQFFMTGITVTSVNGQLVYTPQNQPFPLGVQMSMQPVVSGDRRFVRLNIQQQMTNLASAIVPLFPVTTIVTPVFEGGSQGQPIPFTQFVQQPTFATVNVQTTVVVPDGGTVLLGGMKTLNEGRNEFGPPVLSKIPYINRLFRNVGYGRDAQSLMLMVTPRIIINREEQERQTGVTDTTQFGEP